MLAKDAAKRKRQNQPTIYAFFKRQRVAVEGNLDKEKCPISEAEKLEEAEAVTGITPAVKLSNTNVDETENTLKSDKQEEPLLEHIESQEEDTLEYEMDSLAANYEFEMDNKPLKLGTPFASLNHAPDCCDPLPSLNPHSEHAILFRPYVSPGRIPQPYPDGYRDSWDRSHVRMPCSKESLYPVKSEEKKLVSRWDLIRQSLLHPMSSSYDLEEAMLTYNSHYSKRWNFRNLHLLLLEKMTTEEHKEFFNTTLRAIIQLAVNLPTICTQAVPLLKKQKEHTITMSQQQVASLLANAFLCTFPRRNGIRLHSEHEFGNYPEINFSRLFQGDNRESSSKLEKLKCILHYFKRVTQQPPVGTVSYKRQVLGPDEMPKWHSCSSTMCCLHVSSDGMIEDDASGLLQVDFANEFVGGGVLGEGCVQEEIRFAICPELIVGKLFTERLEENECLIITGGERFSNYRGYSDSFKWTGNHNDQTPRDSWGRLHTKIVAIDAKLYMRYSDQFSPSNLKRDLDKAFCGFLSRETEQRNLPAVATGKWGCGAFNGDPELKSLIQIMAASASNRDVVYFTFNDNDHARKLHDVHTLLSEKNVTVGDLWQMLNEYGKELSLSKNCSLFVYIAKTLEDKQELDNFSDTTFDDTSSPLLFDESPS